MNVREIILFSFVLQDKRKLCEWNARLFYVKIKRSAKIKTDHVRYLKKKKENPIFAAIRLANTVSVISVIMMKLNIKNPIFCCHKYLLNKAYSLSSFLISLFETVNIFGNN